MASRLEFTVGESERHVVVYSWDQFWGRLTITVDGRTVVSSLRMFSLRFANTQELTVGASERHQVRIVKQRPVMFAAFRTQPITAYVDGRGVARTDGTMRPGQNIGIGIAVGVLFVGGFLVQLFFQAH